MKGIKTFNTQTEGLRYFTTHMIQAANRGGFQSDAVKELFRLEVVGWRAASDYGVGDFWGLVCLPILSFFDGVMRGGDDSMRCNFAHDIQKPNKYSGPVTGFASWRGEWTSGRFIRLVFGADGSCRMYYDTGYRGESATPKGRSEFLNLPMAGDEDRSSMSREDFLEMAGSAS